jgi:membrane protease YdiL (CAAX protease family)
MISESFDPKKAFQITRIIFFAMMAGILLFAAMVFYIHSEPFKFSANLSDPILVMILILCCVAIPAGYLYTRNLYRKIDPSFSFREKYPVYQSGLIIRLASCEGVALLCIINLLLSNNLINLVIFIIPFTVIASYYPSPEKIGREVNLTPSEIEKFY